MRSRAVSAGCIRTERVDMTKDSKNQLGVYSVVSDESGRDVWVEIGLATPHHDGQGFDLTLRALPLASRLVLRDPAMSAGDRRQYRGGAEAPQDSTAHLEREDGSAWYQSPRSQAAASADNC